MGWTTGTVRYDCDIKIDLTDIIERFVEKLGKSVNSYGWEFDDASIIIHTDSECRYKNYHCRATLYDPPEDETEFIDSIYDVDVEQLMLDTLHETKRIKTEVEMDESSLDYTEDEPDPDYEYERWRDRGLD